MFQNKKTPSGEEIRRAHSPNRSWEEGTNRPWSGVRLGGGTQLRKSFESMGLSKRGAEKAQMAQGGF